MKSPENRNDYKIIMLNHNKTRIEMLRKKLKEYEDRITSRRTWRESLIFDAGNSYKVVLLETLIRDKQLDPLVVRHELEKNTRNYFDPKTFENALGVIDDYNRTGGKNVVYGTGINGEMITHIPDIPNSSVNKEHTAIHHVFVRKLQK